MGQQRNRDVQDIPALAAAAKSAERAFIRTACSVRQIPIDTRTLPVDYLSISGHKVGGPKGVGALYVRRGAPITPLLYGGTQDRGRRPGTENVAMSIGFARAVELAVGEREAECARLERLRDELETALLAKIPDAVIHGRGASRAPHVVNISVTGTDSESCSWRSTPGRCLSADRVSEWEHDPHTCSRHVRAARSGDGIGALSLGSLSTDAHVARVAECSLPSSQGSAPVRVMTG